MLQCCHALFLSSCQSWILKSINFRWVYTRNRKQLHICCCFLSKRRHHQNLSPGIGHSGIGASLPILIVISLGRIRFFSFPICIDHQQFSISTRQNFWASSITLQNENFSTPLGARLGHGTIQVVQLWSFQPVNDTSNQIPMHRLANNVKKLILS